MQLADAELHIYKGFELVGKIQNFESLRWTRRYNDVGDFSLVMIANRANIDLIKKGDILYKGSDGEAAMIEDVESSDTAGTFTVTGRFLSGLLDRRSINYTRNTNIKTVIYDILRQNFKSGNMNIDILRLIDYTPTVNPTLDAAFKNQNALDVIKRICQDNNIGFKISYNPEERTFDFSLYEGEKTAAEFSENFKNISEQDYYRRTKDYKNTCITPFGNGFLIYGDENKGLDRREIFMTADSDSTASAIREQQRLFLLDHQIKESFDTVISSQSPQFTYKKDWDLGDIVTHASELWGVTVEKNILEIAEYYDKSGIHYAPIFGDLMPV